MVYVLLLKVDLCSLKKLIKYLSYEMALGTKKEIKFIIDNLFFKEKTLWTTIYMFHIR